MKPRGLLSLITFSEKRSEILLMLLEKPRTLDDIKEHFDITSPEIIPQIRKLEAMNLVFQREDRTYVLTDVGTIISKSFNRLINTLDVFEINMGFWKIHDLSGIPEKFLSRFHELGEPKLVTATPTNVFEPHAEFIKGLFRSKNIKGVSPIFHPEYPKAFVKLAEEGRKISIIISKDVFNRIKLEHKQEVNDFLASCRLLTYDEEIKLAFTVTDVFLSLGLFLKDGTYDTQNDLLFYRKSSIKLGENLFKHFEKQSTEVKL